MAREAGTTGQTRRFPAKVTMPQMIRFPFPVLVGDIGGTNARFALVAEPGAMPREVAKLKTGDFGQAREALERAIAACGDARPRSIILCGAGPLDGRRLKLTNAAWLLDGPVLARELGLDQGLTVNDFEAQALSLPVLPDGATQRIGSVEPAAHGPRLALGPGTGLGAALLLEIEGRFVPVASEAGHVELGPLGPEEDAIWPHLERIQGRVTSEAVLSGGGLYRLHKARAVAFGFKDRSEDVVAVTEAALADPASEAALSVRLFWRLIARFAGDLALVGLARGGVYLMGGIGPRIAPLLNADDFRQAFEAKAPMDRLMRSIATVLVTDTDAALHGLAGVASSPERFLLDYQARCWNC